MGWVERFAKLIAVVNDNDGYRFRSTHPTGCSIAFRLAKRHPISCRRTMMSFRKPRKEEIDRPRRRGCQLTLHHSITSSAIASRVGDKLKPKVFAVFRLTINFKRVDCITGSSEGFWPLRIRPA